MLCNVKIEDLEDYMSENDDYFKASCRESGTKMKKLTRVKPSGNTIFKLELKDHAYYESVK